jgi:hypothetical protein
MLRQGLFLSLTHIQLSCQCHIASEGSSKDFFTAFLWQLVRRFNKACSRTDSKGTVCIAQHWHFCIMFISPGPGADPEFLSFLLSFPASSCHKFQYTRTGQWSTGWLQRVELFKMKRILQNFIILIKGILSDSQGAEFHVRTHFGTFFFLSSKSFWIMYFRSKCLILIGSENVHFNTACIVQHIRH